MGVPAISAHLEVLSRAARRTVTAYGRKITAVFLWEPSHTRTVTVMSTSLTVRYGSFTGHYGRNRVYGCLQLVVKLRETFFSRAPGNAGLRATRRRAEDV